MSRLVVIRVTGLATVQDAGRPGHMHEGVPPGGALAPELLARANAAADNAWTEAAIELTGAIRVQADGPLVVASDDGRPVSLQDGETWTLDCAGARVKYLAVRGGLDVPSRVGGRGTLLVAGLGGWQGRALRSGDALPTGGAATFRAVVPDAPDLLAPIWVVAGPDLDRVGPGVLERLLSTTFHVDPRSDRVGVRLAGPRLDRGTRDVGLSAPMVRGAIQLPPDGMPIVLGPDHPTTGGYPVVAVVVRADQGRLGAIPVGGPVRLAAATLRP